MVYSAFYDNSGKEIPIIYPKKQIKESDVSELLPKLFETGATKIQRQPQIRPPAKHNNKKLSEQREKLGNSRKRYMNKYIKEFSDALETYFKTGLPGDLEDKKKFLIAFNKNMYKN
jgi:hypothetical protein